MPLQPYHKLQGFNNIGDSLLLEQLETNLKYWLDFGLLNKGGWEDVNIPQSGIYGGDYSTLRLVDDRSYEQGQVWESAKQDWVWETGVEYPSGDPISVTGVTVNSVAHSLSDSGYECHINYPLGRIIFDSPISSSASVQANYSYRWTQVRKASDCPWWQELQYNSFRVDDSHFEQLNNGDWAIGGQHRVQMPTLIVEALGRSSERGHELGNNVLRIYQDVAFHALADNKIDMNKLLDIIRLQSKKTIILFNTNEVATNEDFPLDYRGMLTDGLMYPDLVDTYPYEKCRFDSTRLVDMGCENPKLHIGTIVATMEIILRNMG